MALFDRTVEVIRFHLTDIPQVRTSLVERYRVGRLLDKHFGAPTSAGLVCGLILGRSAQQAEIEALRDQASVLEELVSKLLDGRG